MARKQRIHPENYDKVFPTRLRELMKGKTQQDLAIYLGKTRQAISYYLDGSSSPDWETLAKIASFFGVSSDYLIGLSQDPNRVPSAVDTIGLSPKAIETIVSWKRRGESKNSILSPMSLHAIAGLSRLAEESRFLALMANVQALRTAIISDKERVSGKTEWNDEMAFSAEIEEIISKHWPEYIGKYRLLTGHEFVKLEIGEIVREFDRLVRSVVEYDDYLNNLYGTDYEVL